MKKIVFLMIALMMVASVAFAQKSIKITPDKLASLKGTWEGTITFSVGNTAPAKLEILNDTVPVKGVFTIINLQDQLAQMLGATGGQQVASNDEGKITTQGTIMWAGPKNFFEFTQTGDKKGNGWFYWNGARGDVTFTKKK